MFAMSILHKLWVGTMTTLGSFFLMVIALSAFSTEILALIEEEPEPGPATKPYIYNCTYDDGGSFIVERKSGHILVDGKYKVWDITPTADELDDRGEHASAMYVRESGSFLYQNKGYRYAIIGWHGLDFRVTKLKTGSIRMARCR